MSSPKDETNLTTDRIRFHDDEERGRPSRRMGDQVQRSRSSQAGSVRRALSSGRADPSLALPIQYRTVSFQIEESRGKSQQELLRAKNTAAKDLNDLEWHTLSVDEVIRRLTTSAADGLSDEQVTRRLETFGRNAPSPPQTHWIKTILGYFFKGFGSVLLVCSILVFICWKPLTNPPDVSNLALAIVLLVVFFIQAAFNMFQDWSTSRVMSSIKHMLPDECQVIRSQTLNHILARDIVPGDVVIVKAGNKLPADMRFIQVSSDAKFDRSVLTGESRPVAAAIAHSSENYLETNNIGLQGTHCILGSCIGVIVATGDKTVFGRIAALTSEPKVKMSTLEKEILHFVIIICSLMVTMVTIAVIVWATWLRREHPDWIDVPTLIVLCVSIAVAFIPEGLPVALTAGLTITANLMKRNKVLCKSLKTVETLGAVSVICSDKTGTLTEGKMTVAECTIGTASMTAEHAREAVTDDVRGSAIHQLKAVAALCNAAELDVATAELPVAEKKIFGDATDSAVLRFAEQLESGTVPYMRACWKKTYELAFNSNNKFMIRCFSNARPEALTYSLPYVQTKDYEAKDLLLTIKGAPDVLLARCTNYLSEAGTVAPLDEEMKILFENTKNEYSAQGKRCLLLARKVLKANTLTADVGAEQDDLFLGHAKSDLTLVGLVAIADPLRPEIPEVVETLRGAGVRVAMVTGDFALTALAVARNAGIISSLAVDGPDALDRNSLTAHNEAKPSRLARNNAIVLSGPDLLALNEHQWAALIQYDEIVFARTTPEQKLRIVKEFQKDNIVAMTGDGVNDAPSLKAADVGISMGSGSDIAMEAADMVLLESFSSIVVALLYGRVVFDNLKKVISYLLPAGSFAEFWPVMTKVLFGLPQILSSFLMIIICCFTDCVAATMLSYEKPEADVLRRPPRNVKKDHLVSWQLVLQSYGVMGIIETLASFAMSYWYLQRNGIPFRDLWFGFGKIPAGIDEDYYQQKLNEASSIYFVNLVVMQWFNLMAVRTRQRSIFQHPPLLNKETQNWYLFPAIMFALGMAIMWLYIPQLRPVVGTTSVPAEHWFLPVCFGIFIILLDEARKYSIRRWPSGLLARAAW